MATQLILAMPAIALDGAYPMASYRQRTARLLPIMSHLTCPYHFYTILRQPDRSTIRSGVKANGLINNLLQLLEPTFRFHDL